jgi:hypothetical protein
LFSLISSITQQQEQQSAASFRKQPPNKKNPSTLFSKSFLSSGKQGGGATVLREGHDIVTGETCVLTSLNVNNLGKAAVMHFASCCLLQLGLCQT